MRGIVVSKAGYKPTVQAIGGFPVNNDLMSLDVGQQNNGVLGGAQFSWPIFDGMLTEEKVGEAVALRARAGEQKAQTTHIVELQVRTAWSDLRTARAVRLAQAKSVLMADRSLQLADIRYEEVASPQIDVLDARASLAEARGVLCRRPAQLFRRPRQYDLRHQRELAAEVTGRGGMLVASTTAREFANERIVDPQSGSRTAVPKANSNKRRTGH